MPPLTTRDWYIGCALQGLLASACDCEIQGEDMMPLTPSEQDEIRYGDIVAKALEIGDACMQLRRDRAEEN